MNNIERYKRILISFKKIERAKWELRHSLGIFEKNIVYSEYLSSNRINKYDFAKALIELAQSEYISFGNNEDTEEWEEIEIETLQEKIKNREKLNDIYVFWGNFFEEDADTGGNLEDFGDEIISGILKIEQIDEKYLLPTK